VPSIFIYTRELKGDISRASMLSPPSGEHGAPTRAHSDRKQGKNAIPTPVHL
jgi:hypothetical protein